MIYNAAGILIFLSVCGTVVSNPDRAVDCRKFVFAPLCRGVAAKRNLPNPGHYKSATLINSESAEQLLRSLYAAMGSLGVNAEKDNQSGIFANAQNEMENAREIYEQDKVNRFLRLLVAKKKVAVKESIFPHKSLKIYNQFAHSNV